MVEPIAILPTFRRCKVKCPRRAEAYIINRWQIEAVEVDSESGETFFTLRWVEAFAPIYPPGVSDDFPLQAIDFAFERHAS